MRERPDWNRPSRADATGHDRGHEISRVPVSRRGYLDWLRGVAVLIMVEAHLFDAWVRVIDRSERPYQWAMVVGGFSAPLFLFLAGVAMALAAGSRLRKGLTASETAAIARRRGWQILGLAFLFRLQSFIISGGPFPQTLLKVDILNVMGLSMVLAAVLWGIGSRNVWRGAALASVALIFAMVTPLVRSAPLVASLPYPFQWYFKAVAGSGAFTLFPWVGFLLLGVVIGLWLDRTRTDDDERRVIWAMAIAGPAIGVVGYLSTALPAIYSGTTFWTGSPTYFIVRLGVLITAIPIAYAWNASLSRVVAVARFRRRVSLRLLDTRGDGLRRGQLLASQGTDLRAGRAVLYRLQPFPLWAGQTEGPLRSESGVPSASIARALARHLSSAELRLCVLFCTGIRQMTVTIRCPAEFR